MQIETERLDLRQWTDADKEKFHQINSDPKVREFFPHIPDRAESDAFVDQCMAEIKEKKFSWFAAEIRDKEELIGFIGLSEVNYDVPFAPAVEIGWRLGPQYWKQGYATEGAKALLSFAFGFLKKDKIVSFTSKTNLPSIAVMERIGMKKVGEFEHPKVPEGSELRHHVLYEISKASFNA